MRRVGNLRHEPASRVTPAACAVALAVASLIATALSATPVRAHDDAVLESPSSSLAAGDSLRLSGKEFDAGGTYRLRLIGALEEHELGEVTADTAGRFTRTLPVTDGARPGAYQVVAVASDGDVVARLDLTVLAAAVEEAEAELGHEGGVSHQEGGARGDEIRIVRERGGVEWALIGLVIGLSGGLGVGLWWRSAA